MPAKKDQIEQEPVISANPLEIEWPRDEYQMTHNLRNEIKRAAARMYSDKNKLELIKATLKVGAAHATARLERDIRDSK